LKRRSDDRPKEVEMRNAFRIALVIGAIVIVAALGLTAFASGSSPTLSSTPTSTMSPSDDGPFDISGNCDEPEHFNDAECEGVTPGVGNDADDDRADDDVDGVDADDVNDDDADVDGIGDDDVDDDGDVDDNSGPSANSGPGNVEDDVKAEVDNSGPGNGDGDADADNSGSGDGDHDNSGSGGGDD
jgi:hypothetical protein